MKKSANNRHHSRTFTRMTSAKRSITRGRVALAILCLALLASEAISLGLSHKHVWQIGAPSEAAKTKMRTGTSALPAAATSAPQPDDSFTVDTSVIAGGGGSSDSGGTAPIFTLDGTIGEPAAGTVSSGGNFVQGNGFTFASSNDPLPPPPVCVAVSVPAGLATQHNATLTVPVNASDTTGQGLISFDLTFTYDSSVMTFQSVDSAGTLSSAFTITINNTPGQLVVSGFGTLPLTGSGTLLNLNFSVSGLAGTCSNLNLTSFQFNEGIPCLTTTNGGVCVFGTISGAVRYGIGLSGPISSLGAVPGVTLAAAGAPGIHAFTNSSGAYLLSGLGGGAYTVTPTKSGDDRGSITAQDAAITAQQVVGATTLTANQQIAADASNNGVITSFDAALIAQYAVGLSNPASIAGTWKFVPASRSYSDTTVDHPGENYTALLIGEVSGNWTATSGLPSITQPEGAQINASAISVSLPQTSAAQGANVTIPITSGDVSSQNVTSYDLDLAFDPTVLQPQLSPVDFSGTLSTSLSFAVNRDIPGHVRIAAFGTAPLIGAGTLLNLKFTVVGAPGSTTALTAQNFQYNEGNPQVTKANGQFSVSPTATVGTVTGTVIKSDGTPLPGVVIQLDGPASRKMITDALGNYRFDNLDPSGVYTAAPSRTNYQFGPPSRTFSLAGSHMDASFTALPNGTSGNPLDTPEYFVRQHYLDFLNREPDEAGFNFWSDSILTCGFDTSCIEVKRINASAAYFLSIEFQETGYLVYRMNKAAYGNLPGAPVPVRFGEFMPDVRTISQGVIVNQTGWQQQLENNKQAFSNDFVARARFMNLYGAMSNSQFVDALNQNADNVLSATERADLSSALTSGAKTRAQVLRQVAENGKLNQQEFNKAFVLMQYFGYLRRDPNSGQDSDFSGYNFWLTKLNQFNGNFVQAEMVKAFILSTEYRGRFGP